MWQKSRFNFLEQAKLLDNCFVVLQIEMLDLKVVAPWRHNVTCREEVHHMRGCAGAKHMVWTQCCHMHVSHLCMVVRHGGK